MPIAIGARMVRSGTRDFAVVAGWRCRWSEIATPVCQMTHLKLRATDSGCAPDPAKFAPVSIDRRGFVGLAEAAAASGCWAAERGGRGPRALKPDRGMSRQASAGLRRATFHAAPAINRTMPGRFGMLLPTQNRRGGHRQCQRPRDLHAARATRWEVALPARRFLGARLPQIPITRHKSQWSLPGSLRAAVEAVLAILGCNTRAVLPTAQATCPIPSLRRRLCAGQPAHRHAIRRCPIPSDWRHQLLSHFSGM